MAMVTTVSIVSSGTERSVPRPRPILLIADDEPQVLRLLTRVGDGEGFQTITCTGGREAIETIQHARVDLALVDLRMPDIGGLDVIREIHRCDPECQIALLTGHATVDSVVEAIKRGATDCLTKPVNLDRIRALLGDVRAGIGRRRQLMRLELQAADQLQCFGMIGRSAVMQELFELVRRLAPHARTALVVGETGTGKELVARALHKLGPRCRRRFVTVNCSAVVESLFESEMFGHNRGAFTGATQSKAGIFETAEGGTLFLDEVGELPIPLQAKLLRVMETGEVQRVGALEPRRVDVRIVAATNRDLEAEVQAGRFREDLLYRLNVVTILPPPLRQRREDIPYLIAAFVREFSGQFGKSIASLTTHAERVLMEYAWPGNVRELRNMIERACILSEGEVLGERDFVSDAGSSVLRPGGLSRQLTADPRARELKVSEELGRDRLVDALREAGGNKAAAARNLGLSRRSLYRRLAKHSLIDSSSGS